MKKCTVEGCESKHYALGYCRKHHIRFKRNGTTDSKYDKEGYSKLGGIKDMAPGRRGSLAVNIINDIKYKSMQRGKRWQLTHEEAFSLIIAPCNYCGYEPEWPNNRVGIDRVLNDEGYHMDNCVPCCSTCNSAKGTMNLDDFITWVKRIHAKLTA